MSCFIALCLGLSAEVFYQWKSVYIGALENRAWTGLMFAPHPQSVFAFRIRTIKQGEISEGKEHIYLISEVGPHSPDGQYARLKLDMGLPFKKAENTPVLKKP